MRIVFEEDPRFGIKITVTGAMGPEGDFKQTFWPATVPVIEINGDPQMMVFVPSETGLLEIPDSLSDPLPYRTGLAVYRGKLPVTDNHR